MTFIDSPIDVEFVEPVSEYLERETEDRDADEAEIDPSVTDAADVQILVGQYETGNYGQDFLGASDADGVVSFGFQTPGVDMTLFVQGFDIDTSTEVEVLMNDVSVGYLTKGGNSTLQLTTLSISQDLLIAGENVLSFRQTNYPTYQWGVTDILLMGDGLNISELPIDPEFSDDGYVAWQSVDYFYLGLMDPASGAMVSVVNEVGIKPTDIRLTQQGPEIITTSTDGIGAIGVSPYGLVHYTMTGATILADTVGFKIGYMPKGETPGLRFTAHDTNSNIILYDNGTITPLDFGGGIVTSWLNASEFIVSYRSVGIEQIGIYNLDTGVMTTFAQESYGSPAHQAAFTASDGVQYMALAGDDYHDLWQNDGSGWQLFRTISCPILDSPYFYSPEFFEWQGRVFLAGVSSGAPGAQDSVPALYDIGTDTWSQPGAHHGIAEPIVDPEIVAMNDNSLAYYFSDISDPANFIEYFFTVTYQDVLEATVIDLNDTIDGNGGVSDGGKPTGFSGGGKAGISDGALANWTKGDVLGNVAGPEQGTVLDQSGAGHLTDLEFGFAVTYNTVMGAFAPEIRAATEQNAAPDSSARAPELPAGTEDTFVFDAAEGATTGLQDAEDDALTEAMSALRMAQTEVSTGPETFDTGFEPLGGMTANSDSAYLLSNVIDRARLQILLNRPDAFTGWGQRTNLT